MFLKNKYTIIYQNIIDRARGRLLTDVYYEVHHIIPRCMGGNDEPENLVRLTAREHFICHRLLPKMVTGEARDSLNLALFLMSARATYNSLPGKEYERLRVLRSRKLSQDNPMFDRKTVNKFLKSRCYKSQSKTCSDRNKAYWGIHDNRVKLSEQNKERWADPEYRERVSRSIKSSWTPERRERASRAAKARWAKRKGGGSG